MDYKTTGNIKGNTITLENEVPIRGRVTVIILLTIFPYSSGWRYYFSGTDSILFKRETSWMERLI